MGIERLKKIRKEYKKFRLTCCGIVMMCLLPQNGWQHWESQLYSYGVLPYALMWPFLAVLGSRMALKGPKLKTLVTK